MVRSVPAGHGAIGRGDHLALAADTVAPPVHEEPSEDHHARVPSPPAKIATMRPSLSVVVTRSGPPYSSICTPAPGIVVPLAEREDRVVVTERTDTAAAGRLGPMCCTRRQKVDLAPDALRVYFASFDERAGATKVSAWASDEQQEGYRSCFVPRHSP